MAALEIVSLDTTTPQLRAPSAADTYTAPRAMDITPVALTGSSATSSLSIAQTWNTTGTPTALDLNVTDTASNASSLLMNLRVGGTSRFSVTKAGYGTFAAGSSVQPSIMIAGGGGNSGFGSTNGFDYSYIRAGAAFAFFGFERFDVSSNTALNWSSTGAAGGTPDLTLRRDAANTLAQRNGVNAQALRVYRTFTDTSNFIYGASGYGAIFGDTSVFDVGTRGLGTGAAGSPLRICTVGNNLIYLNTNSVNRWQVTGTGHFVAEADNTYDIGASGANRPRDIYTAGKIDIGNGNLTLSNDVRLSRRASGVLLLDNNGGTDFGRLQFGGTTSSFPALKRSGTTLETKLADDSGFAPHAAEWLSVTDGVTAPGAAAGRARIYVDSADGDLKVVFADGTVKTIVTDT